MAKINLMETSYDRSKTLQELENDDWGESAYSSYLVTTCHRLRRKPLMEFTDEDLRIMIGQNIGLPYLMPIAVERLVDNYFSSGDFNRGDLLRNVLKVEASFWKKHPKLWWEVDSVVSGVEDLLQTVEKEILPLARIFRSNGNP